MFDYMGRGSGPVWLNEAQNIYRNIKASNNIAINVHGETSSGLSGNNYGVLAISAASNYMELSNIQETGTISDDQ